MRKRQVTCTSIDAGEVRMESSHIRLESSLTTKIDYVISHR